MIAERNSKANFSQSNHQLNVLIRYEDEFYGVEKKQETDLKWVEDSVSYYALPILYWSRGGGGGGGGGGKSLWDAAREIVASREQGKFQYYTV